MEEGDLHMHTCHMACISRTKDFDSCIKTIFSLATGTLELILVVHFLVYYSGTQTSRHLKQ